MVREREERRETYDSIPFKMFVDEPSTGDDGHKREQRANDPADLSNLSINGP